MPAAVKCLILSKVAVWAYRISVRKAVIAKRVIKGGRGYEACPKSSSNNYAGQRSGYIRTTV